MHNRKGPGIAITALWGLYILKSMCQSEEHIEAGNSVKRDASKHVGKIATFAYVV